MAVDFNFLRSALTIQDVFVDQTLPDTVSQVASGAQVFFFKTDQITPKNIYIQTGDPMNPYIVAANPQVLNAAGRLEQKIFFYFYDEADDEPTNEELYYIRVVNTQGQIIDEIDDFLPNQESGGGGEVTSLENLSPSYAFDVIGKYNDSQWRYGNAYQTYINEVGTYPALGFVWVISAPTQGDFYYTFTDVAIGTLDGDPLNYINLIQENFGSSQTNCFFAFPICQHQELIGSTLTFQFIAQDQSGTPVTSLDVGILRGPPTSNANLINWGAATIPINVGTVSLDTSLSVKSVTFTMPTEVLSPEPSTATYMTIGLPLDQDFNIALTGFYVYQGEGETLIITRDNLGNRYSRVFSQAMNSFLLSGVGNYRSINQPIIRSEQQGAFNFQDRTGIFFERPLDQEAQNTNFSILAAGQNVVSNYSYREGGGAKIIQLEGGDLLLGDRYLQKYSSNVGQLADNAFVISNVTATSFQVRTRLQHASHSGWVSNSGALVITPIGGPSQHLVTAAVDGGIPERVNITNTANYTALTHGYHADPGDFATYQLSGVAQNAYVTYFGTITSNNTPITGVFTPLPGFAFGTINGGSPASQASGFIQFPVGAIPASQIQTTSTPVQIGNPPVTLWTQYLNCLQFLNPATAGSSQLPLIAPYAIQFKVDGAGQNVPVSDTLLTVNVPSTELVNGATLASAVVAILNSATEYILTFNGIPANGENFFFSSTYKDFIAIFWQTAQIQPVNPVPTRPAIYIQIAPGATIQDVVNTTAAVMQVNISAIPTAADLNITLGNDLALWMEA